MNEKYENSPLTKNLEVGSVIGMRKVDKGGKLSKDAEILVGSQTYPLIARRKINEGWVYCVNVSAYVTSTDLVLISNLIK